MVAESVMLAPFKMLAVLVTLVGALPATFTVRAMGRWLLPAANASLRLQLTVEGLHVHPLPLMVLAVSPAGSAARARRLAR
jgi:hypothetical protein